MRAFFVGIKGVGMTSLACAMQDAAWIVAGSDTAEEFITDEVLRKRNITVYEDIHHVIPQETDLVICSAAYAAPETTVRVVPLAVALAEFVADRKVIAVAGVGGKTTSSAMLAALFHATGRDVGYYVGTSTIAGLDAPGHAGTDPYYVIESDEYAIGKDDHRAKFELLAPDIVITTNIVHDHPDIYPDESATVAVFEKLVHSIRQGGTWIYNPADRLTQSLISRVVRTDIVMTPYSIDPTLELSVFGDQNRLDAAAAVLAAQAAGCTAEESRAGIAAYKGAGRRQEFHGVAAGRYLYDDYGHHPGEISVTVRSFKEKYPDARVLLVFESHTYTRTEALLDDFAQAIASADQAFIMPIFESAREKGKEHVITTQSFAAMIPGATALTWANAAESVSAASRSGDIILTMGAGFVYKLHAQLKDLLK